MELSISYPKVQRNGPGEGERCGEPSSGKNSGTPSVLLAQPSLLDLLFCFLWSFNEKTKTSLFLWNLLIVKCWIEIQLKQNRSVGLAANVWSICDWRVLKTGSTSLGEEGDNQWWEVTTGREWLSLELDWAMVTDLLSLQDRRDRAVHTH